MDRDVDLPRAPWFDVVTFHAILAGLCPLIPIPFVDDLVLVQVRKRMVREVADKLGRSLEEPDVAVLSGAAQLEPGRGCVAGCLVVGAKITVSLVLRFFKKVVVFLTLKEAVDKASLAFYEGVLLHHALTSHGAVLRQDDERQAGARRMRRAVVKALRDVELRPIQRIVAGIFQGSKDALAEGAKILARGRTRATEAEGGVEVPLPVAEEAAALSGLTERLREALWKEQGTISLLRGRLDARLADPPSLVDSDESALP
jgi:uncharacterized protein (DUF697 family)